MSSWQVVVPWIGPDTLLTGCIQSMGDSPADILIVDNTGAGRSRSLPVSASVEIAVSPHNIGLSAAWNMGLRAGADYTLILSAAVRFRDGLSRVIGEVESLNSPLGATTHLSFHAFIMGRELVETVGEFDERFYPYEFEDTDYTRRMFLAGIPYSSLPLIGDGGLWSMGTSIAGKLGLFKMTTAPREHYQHKWGGDPGHELWDVPFNGGKK